jgi:hypothetical protein
MEKADPLVLVAPHVIHHQIVLESIEERREVVPRPLYANIIEVMKIHHLGVVVMTHHHLADMLGNKSPIQ